MRPPLLPLRRAERDADNEVRSKIKSGNFKKEDNDTVIIKNSEFDEFIIEVRKNQGHGFTKTLRDVSDQVFINLIRNFMKVLYF